MAGPQSGLCQTLTTQHETGARPVVCHWARCMGQQVMLVCSCQSTQAHLCCMLHPCTVSSHELIASHNRCPLSQLACVDIKADSKRSDGRDTVRSWLLACVDIIAGSSLFQPPQQSPIWLAGFLCITSTPDALTLLQAFPRWASPRSSTSSRGPFRRLAPSLPACASLLQ